LGKPTPPAETGGASRRNIGSSSAGFSTIAVSVVLFRSHPIDHRLASEMITRSFASVGPAFKEMCA